MHETANTHETDYEFLKGSEFLERDPDCEVVLLSQESGVYGFCNDVTLRNRGEFNYVLRSDYRQIPEFSQHLSNLTGLILRADSTTSLQIELALVEALNNSLIHGNFEISSEIRESDDGAYFELLNERQNSPPYRERNLYVTYRWNSESVMIEIRDEGNGFDVSQVLDAKGEDAKYATTGRGIIMIKGLMDEVCYDSAGNEITMVKHFS